MPADATATSVLSPDRRVAEVAAPSPTLTRLAGRNAGAALLDYTVRLVAGLVVTPILVRGLGPTLFGAWEMLQRLGGYVNATDGRPTEALRLVIAQADVTRQSAAKRRLVGAALVVWLLLLPMVVGVGALLVYYAPAIVGTADLSSQTLRIAAGILVATALLGTLASVPESVLRGLNLGYTRVGVQSALQVVGALLAATAVWAGTGVIGLAAATLAVALLTGGCFWLLVRHRVAWFGATRPRRAEVHALLSMSIWLTAGDLIAKLLLASDVLILGAVLAPAAVASYVLTGYAARVAVGVHVFTAGEALPGIGACLGREEFARARRARRELLAMTWLYVTVAGTTILLWNRSFLALWVGAPHYAGPVVDALLVLIAAQTAFIRLDSGMIDAALRPRARVGVGAAAAAVTLTLGLSLTPRWGMTGLCVGLLTGRLIQSVAYPLLVAGAFRDAAAPPEASAPAWRAALTTALLFVVALRLAPQVPHPDWFTFAGGVVLSVPAIGIAAWYLGLPPALRAAILKRLPRIGRSPESR